TTTLAHRLADYACALEFAELSPEVVHEVKRRVIDSIGCALGAWKEEPCRIAREVALEFSAKRGSTFIGTNHKAPPDWTASAGGCASRYFDYNDTYLSRELAQRCVRRGSGSFRTGKGSRLRRPPATVCIRRCLQVLA